MRIFGVLWEPGCKCSWDLGVKRGDSIKVQKPPEARTWRIWDVRLRSL